MMHDKLLNMMIRENEAIKWAKMHISCFEYSKLVLINFAHLGLPQFGPELWSKPELS
jgi:hypothetical protein